MNDHKPHTPHSMGQNLRPRGGDRSLNGGDQYPSQSKSKGTQFWPISIDVNSFLFKGSPCECESHHFLRAPEWNSAPACSSVAHLTFYLGLEIRSKENGWLFLIQNVNWLAESDRVHLKKRQILRCLLLSKFLNQRGLSKHGGFIIDSWPV